MAPNIRKYRTDGLQVPVRRPSAASIATAFAFVPRIASVVLALVAVFASTNAAGAATFSLTRQK